jgi:hypothetical protein
MPLISFVSTVYTEIPHSTEGTSCTRTQQLYRKKKQVRILGAGKQAIHLQFSETKRESTDSFDWIEHKTDAAGPLSRSCLRRAGDPRVLLHTDERAASCLLCFGSIQLRRSY